MKPSAPSADAPQPARSALKFAEPADQPRTVRLSESAEQEKSVKFSAAQTAAQSSLRGPRKLSPGATKLLTRKPTPFSTDLQDQIKSSGLAAWAASVRRAKEEAKAAETGGAASGKDVDGASGGAAASRGAGKSTGGAPVASDVGDAASNGAATAAAAAVASGETVENGSEKVSPPADGT